MIDAGMEAVIIKVAGIGLTTKHLGLSLGHMQSTLIKLVRFMRPRCCNVRLIIMQNGLYGSHICGEGGEYETLTLDCPLFKHKITLYVPLEWK